MNDILCLFYNLYFLYLTIFLYFIILPPKIFKIIKISEGKYIIYCYFNILLYLTRF